MASIPSRNSGLSWVAMLKLFVPQAFRSSNAVLCRFQSVKSPAETKSRWP